jgi:hypothetical protein
MGQPMKHIVSQQMDKLRPYLLWTLVFVAIFGRIFKFDEISSASLIAALLLVISILLDIYKQTAPLKDEAVKFERFDGAVADMRSRVSKLFETNSPINIKWIGMTMEYGAPALIDVISDLEKRHFLKRLSIEVVMLDPKWKGARRLNALWPEQISVNASKLAAALPFENSELSVFDEAPGIHGFLINDRHLYVSRCSWKDMGGDLRMFGGENPYEYFDIQLRGESAWEGRNFVGWLRYFQQRKIDLEARNPSAAQN